jgi:hypothetical protein
MLWQPDYMPRVQVGLPQINLDAPRLLAHCFLFEIDSLLLQSKNIDFARYMDDIDVGVDSVADAKLVLRDLDLALQTRQIRLNSGKTKILTEEEARRHFCIRENSFLDRLEDSVRSKLLLGLSIEREKRFIEDAISVGLTKGLCARGNGEKILRRLINYARSFSGRIKDVDFSRILLAWPGCRSIALQWWYHYRSPDRQLGLIRDFVSSAEIVDDASLVAIGVALVAARLPANSRTRRLLNELCAKLDQSKPAGFFAKAWILSKYGSSNELMRLIEATRSLWVTEEHLARLVGGLYPRMIRSPPHLKKFQALVARSGNRSCQEVVEFHQSLRGKIGFAAVQKFVRATNPSQPNKISHAKFLMLLSLVYNFDVTPALVAELMAGHAVALTDEYYKKLLPPERERAHAPANEARLPPSPSDREKINQTIARKTTRTLARHPRLPSRRLSPP